MAAIDTEVVSQEVQVRYLDSKGSELAVFEFQGELRDSTVSSLHEAYLTTGNYASAARAVSPHKVRCLRFLPVRQP